MKDSFRKYFDEYESICCVMCGTLLLQFLSSILVRDR